MDDEQWLPIPGHETSYAVSDQGRVKSLQRIVVRSDGVEQPVNERILKASPGLAGRYLGVMLYASGKGERLAIHRLVARTFLGEPPNGQVVRHLDGDPHNNRLENLAWGTASENMADMARHGRNWWANKTHCKRGHRLEHPNLYTSPSQTGRSCVACNRERASARAEGRPFDPVRANDRYRDVLAGRTRRNPKGET